ncbi:7-cyano-7-deazaguanine synthase QueC [bacterium]|nr:MAG: 7-cyano-7-deazaguanine synthase QueC [bacterium]
MSKKPKRAVVLHSGGIDSTVSAAVARRDGYELYMLHFDYGQLTESKERSCFAAIGKAFKVKKQEIANVRFLKWVGHSSLTDEHIPVPTGEPEGIPTTYVPFRNGIFLSLAAAWAETVKAQVIYIGTMEEDGPGYPDTSEKFIEAMQKAINLGRKPESKCRIIAPIIHLTKAEVIKLGAELLVPFGMTWSCYKDEDIACGVCQSCIMRRRAFREAGIKDPIMYRV